MATGIAISAINANAHAEAAEFRVVTTFNNGNDDSPFGILLPQYRETVVNSLITAFGLDRLLFTDIDGGNVQTIHNAENHIYANDTFQERGERKYNRDDYATSAYMHQRRKKDFQNQETITDGYTGANLSKDGQTHLEHVVSAKENHDNSAFRLLFEKEEMHEIINDNNNTLYTNSSLNQSKGEKPLDTWLEQTKKGETQQNAERFGVNTKKAKAADKKARKFIDEHVTKQKINHYATSITQDSLKQGGAMAVRQALGVIFTEVTMTIWDELPKIKASFTTGANPSSIFDHLTNLVKKSFEKIKSKMKAILEALNSGFCAGMFNSITTAIINMFVTTAKNIVRLVRQAMVSITEATRILFFDKQKRPLAERIAAALKIISVGAATALGVLLEQTLSEALSASGLSAIPGIGATLVESISTFSGILVTGLLSVTFLYVLDTSELIKKMIKFIDSLCTDGVAKALEQINHANKLLDEYVAKLCEIDLAKLTQETAQLHKLNAAISAGNTDEVYQHCRSAGIQLQFNNTAEFISFMEDDDTVLEI